jgi:toxin ParE1/3/4
VARFRLSRPAQADLGRILATSLDRWGNAGQRRYATILTTATRVVANEPQGFVTRDRAAPQSGLRSFHLRHVRIDDPRVTVCRPVHVISYREVQPGLVEIVRILHERMEPGRWLGGVSDKDK